MKSLPMTPENFELLQGNIDSIIQHLDAYMREKNLPFQVTSIRLRELATERSKHFAKLSEVQRDSAYVEKLQPASIDNLKAKFETVNVVAFSLEGSECSNGVDHYECSDLGICVAICR
jgi:hypothetical protein